MRDYLLISEDMRTWRTVAETTNHMLGRYLDAIADGRIDDVGMNGGVSNEDVRERILIELRARELGLCSA